MKFGLQMLILPLRLLLPLAAIFYFTPLFTRPGIYFGATVDPEFPSSRDGRLLLRSYRWQVVFWTLMAMLMVVIFFPTHPAFAEAGVPLLLLVPGASISYWRNFREIHARYGVRKAEIRRASLSGWPAKDGLSVWMTLLPFVALAATALYLRGHWNDLPQHFPVHWGMDGQPNGWSNRDGRGVYGPLLFGAYLDGVLLALAWFIGRESRKTVMRSVTVRGIQFMVYPLTFAFIFIAVLRRPDALGWLIPGVMFVSMAGMFYRSYRRISDSSAEDEVPEPQNDAYWKAGAFYWNPNDPAIFVSKRVGIGYTMNFANAWSWITMIAVLAAILVPVVFLSS